MVYSFSFSEFQAVEIVEQLFRIGSGSDSPLNSEGKEVQEKKGTFDSFGCFVQVYG